jgi:hypothetical protein
MIRFDFAKSDKNAVFSDLVNAEYLKHNRNPVERALGHFSVEENSDMLSVYAANRKFEKQLGDFIGFYDQLSRLGDARAYELERLKRASDLSLIMKPKELALKRMLGRMNETDMFMFKAGLDKTLALFAQCRAMNNYTRFLEDFAVNDLLFKRCELVKYISTLKQYKDDTVVYMAAKFPGLKYKGYAFVMAV